VLAYRERLQGTKNPKLKEERDEFEEFLADSRKGQIKPL
jgi:hypothetical protein